jgi:glutathione S-transferase
MLPPVFPLSNYAALQVLPRMARENPDPALMTESLMAVVASDDEARTGPGHLPRSARRRYGMTVYLPRNFFDDVHLSLLQRANQMIIVHHLNDSRSHRVLWLLEELNIPYEIKLYQRDPKTGMAPPELKAVHPLGKSPVISTNGHIIAESGAIVDHIIRHYGRGQLEPNHESVEYDEYVQWLHFAEGSAMTPLILRASIKQLGEAGKPLLALIESEIALNLRYIEETLRERRFLVGHDISAADIQNSFVGEIAAARVGIDGYPLIRDWLERLQTRPAYQAAITRGGAYSFAFT